MAIANAWTCMKEMFIFFRRPECIALKGHSACGERTTLAPSSPPKLNQMCNEAGGSSNYFHLSRDRLHVNANACSPNVDLGCLTETPWTFQVRLSFPCCLLALSYTFITRQPSQFCHSHPLFFSLLLSFSCLSFFYISVPSHFCWHQDLISLPPPLRHAHAQTDTHTLSCISAIVLD